MSDRADDADKDEDATEKRVDAQSDEGVGWLPAILAGSLLLAALLFVCCGVTTWMLFQKRVELAGRTLAGSTIPTIEQSQLRPESKRQLVDQLRAVVDDAESGRLEQWQAGGIMNRLTRIPILEWGDLDALQRIVANRSSLTEEEREEAVREFSRLRLAIQQDSASIYDVAEVLEPVLVEDSSLRGRRLDDDLSDEQLREVILRARLVADRCKIPDQQVMHDSIVTIVGEAIAAGRSEGSL